MNGRAKNMRFRIYMESTAALLSFLLLLTAYSTKIVAASRNQQCENIKPALKDSRLAYQESLDLVKTYKTSQGKLSKLICKVSVSNIPDANVSGMEISDRIASIYQHLQAFFPHFKRVYEQQTALQPPDSQLLIELTRVTDRSWNLAYLVKNLYQNLFPNLPVLGPAGRPTTLPPPQNVFQQKVYGCAVLKTYKELIATISSELRTLKSKVCRRRIHRSNSL